MTHGNRNRAHGAGGRTGQGGGHGGERRPLPPIVFEENGKLKADLFDKQAHEAAKAVADCRREMNKSTQLRRFYDELVMWQERCEQSPGKFDDYLPMIRMLKAKAAYARGRKLVDAKFERLLGQIVDHATSVESLRHSRLFFEAFLGFYKQEKGD